MHDLAPEALRSGRMDLPGRRRPVPPVEHGARAELGPDVRVCLKQRAPIAGDLEAEVRGGLLEGHDVQIAHHRAPQSGPCQAPGVGGVHGEEDADIDVTPRSCGPSGHRPEQDSKPDPRNVGQRAGETINHECILGAYRKNLQ